METTKTDEQAVETPRVIGENGDQFSRHVAYEIGAALEYYGNGVTHTVAVIDGSGGVVLSRASSRFANDAGGDIAVQRIQLSTAEMRRLIAAWEVGRRERDERERQAAREAEENRRLQADLPF